MSCANPHSGPLLEPSIELLQNKAILYSLDQFNSKAEADEDLICVNPVTQEIVPPKLTCIGSKLSPSFENSLSTLANSIDENKKAGFLCESAMELQDVSECSTNISTQTKSKIDRIARPPLHKKDFLCEFCGKLSG